VGLAREPQRLETSVEGLVVEPAAAVLPEDGNRLGGPGGGLGDVEADGLGLGEAGSGDGQKEREAEDAGDQPCVPVRAT
jgi:hypothetical protein